MSVRSIAVLAALVLAAPLAAQQSATPARDTMQGGPQRLKEIESSAERKRAYRASSAPSASRLPISLRETPQAVTVLSRQFVADQGVQSLGEAARFLPGVTFGQGEGHRDAPTIRGNASTSALFVDGMRDDTQYYRDFYATERLEAVKGPNALMFGRGVGGGILNRVTKVAGFSRVRELSLQGGEFGQRRGTLDVGGAVAGPVAVRLNAMYENTDLFRREVGLERWGVMPTLTVRASGATIVTASYERFSDDRTVDRGVPSLNGVPLAGERRTFFGNPGSSQSRADVNIAVAGVVTHVGAATLRSRVQYAAYDKFYANVFPGAVNAAAGTVSLSAYDNGTDRWNALSQTDLTVPMQLGGVRHQVVTGVELGQQITSNVRRTGFFQNDARTVNAPLTAPQTDAAPTYRNTGSDADNRSLVRTAAVFVQDRVELSSWLAVIGGLRVERFDLDFDNRRTATRLSRTDDLVSPRLGAVVTPVEAISFYGSYATAQLPSSGEQFSSLTATTQTLGPESFQNYEVGAKAELARGLALTVAAYRLDRTNTTAPSPTDPAVLLQTGSQRTDGVEADISGTPMRGWQVVAGYSHQNARITSTTTAAPAGRRAPITPRNQASLWNRVDLPRGLGVGFGVIHQGSMFASIDNAVTLPAWTRMDAALFVPMGSQVRAQLNVENLFDRSYFATAHNNNNITPGTPRLVRVSFATGF